MTQDFFQPGELEVYGGDQYQALLGLGDQFDPQGMRQLVGVNAFGQFEEEATVGGDGGEAHLGAQPADFCIGGSHAAQDATNPTGVARRISAVGVNV
jgi:hypothetical protein